MLDLDTIKVTYHGDRNIDTEEFLKQYTKLISTVNRELCGDSLSAKYSIREYKFKDGYVMFRVTSHPGYAPFDFFTPANGLIGIIPEIYNICCVYFISANSPGKPSENISTNNPSKPSENKTEPDTVGFSFDEKFTVCLLLIFIIAIAITLK